MSPTVLESSAAAGRRVARFYWPVRDLVVLGVFAVAAKLSTLAVAMAGAGPNPLTLMAKNCIFTTLVIVVLFKIRKPGTLTLFAVVNLIISLLLLGGTVNLLIPPLVCAPLAEGVMVIGGGIRRPWSPYIGAAFYDLSTKIMTLAMSWLTTREAPQVLYMVAMLVVIGYVGSLIGLFTGHKAVKELRRAGLAAY